VNIVIIIEKAIEIHKEFSLGFLRAYWIGIFPVLQIKKMTHRNENYFLSGKILK
jgi:hypothetical protein